MMMYKKIALAAVFAVSSISVIAAVNAQEEKATTNTLPETTLSLVQAVEVATKDNTGTVTSATLEMLTEKPFYSIDIETETTGSHILVDANNGDVIGKLAITIDAADDELFDYLTDLAFGLGDELDMLDVLDEIENLDDLSVLSEDELALLLNADFEFDSEGLQAELDAIESCLDDAENAESDNDNGKETTDDTASS